MDLLPSEDLLLQQISLHPKGISISALSKNTNASQLMAQLNSLSQKQRLEFLTYQDGTNGVKSISMDQYLKLKDLSVSEKQVYNFIKSCGNKGTWLKDIKLRSGLHQQVVNQAIKSLERLNHIKAIKSVKNPTKKLFILADLEPSVELTGGTWYTDDVLDVEFIDQLCAQLLKFIQSKAQKLIQDGAFPAIPEMHDWLSKSGITSAALTLDDVSALVNRLVYDGSIVKIAKYSSSEDEPQYMYKINRASLDNSWTMVPCGKCKLISRCRDDSPISPQKCEYYIKWLNQW